MAGDKTLAEEPPVPKKGKEPKLDPIHEGMRRRLKEMFKLGPSEEKQEEQRELISDEMEEFI